MAKGRPSGLRLETAVRTQIEFQQSSLDDLLAPDHRARQVWDYVEDLDLSVLYGRVQTTVSSSGRPAIDPAILVSLWLYRHEIDFGRVNPAFYLGIVMALAGGGLVMKFKPNPAPKKPGTAHAAPRTPAAAPTRA